MHVATEFFTREQIRGWLVYQAVLNCVAENRLDGADREGAARVPSHLKM
jgi:hypothetical protein